MIWKFCVLGTKAGGVPLKTKHPSATALMLPKETMVFDCGEGTQTQLLRAGISRAEIDHIFISHLHADHIIGLLGLLTTFAADKRKDPLAVYAPEGLQEYIVHSLRIMDVTLGFPMEVVELSKGFAGELIRKKNCVISAQMLEHRIPSFGFRVNEIPHVNIDIHKADALGLKEGNLLGAIKRTGSVFAPNGTRIFLEDIVLPAQPPLSFVYCGDTRKCGASIELSQNADVLIHEATFDNEFRDKARERFHSTAEHAAEVACAANVRRLFITHISTRYKSAAPLLRQARTIFPTTFLAKELRVESLEHHRTT
jgi:ribonuclease Z